jgi:Rnl2 family RNA ligase
MSVTVTRATDEVLFARRHAFLGSDTAFMGYADVLPGLARWRDFLEDAGDTVHTVTIFGEFFGGSYPGFPSGPGKPIQTGVHYSPVKRFVAFDIRVDSEAESTFVDFGVMQGMCRKHDVPHVQIGFEGTFDEVLHWCKAHASDDVDPALYQVPDSPIVAGNAGEGWVLRPVTEQRSTFAHNRVMVKVKNPMFSESARVSGVGRVKADPAVSELITDARVANVLTKERPESLTYANFKHLVALVVKDAQEDEAEGTSDTKGARPREDPAITTKTAGALVQACLTKCLAAPICKAKL